MNASSNQVNSRKVFARAIARMERQKAPEPREMLASNESLKAIVKALRPGKEDIILSICGSGDQAFVLAQYGARVYAVDSNPEQLAYAKQRAEFARSGKHIDFLTHKRSCLSYQDNTLFLANKYRFERIRKTVGRISFHQENIFDLPVELQLPYTKMYLSNAIGWNPSLGLNEMDTDVDNIIHLLEPGGLVYATDGENLNLSNKEFSFQQRLTSLARRQEENSHPKYNYWRPAIYCRR